MRSKGLLFVILLWGTCFAYGQTSGEGVDYLYAKKLYSDSMYDLAAKQFHEFAEKYPNNPQAADALLLAGDSYFKLNRYEEARREYIYLILRFPEAKNLDQAQYKIGDCYRASGNYVEAARAFQQVKILHPKSELADDALFDAGRMYVLGNEYDLAIEAFFDYLEEFPTNPSTLDVQLELAKTFNAKGELARASNEIDKILETTEKGAVRAQALLLRAEIQESLGRTDQAEQTYRSILTDVSKTTTPPKNILAQTQLKLASIYRSKGQYAESNKYLSTLRVDDLDQEVSNSAKLMMGDNNFDLGNYSQALQQYQTIDAGSDTLFFRLTFNMGITYEKLQDFQNAIESFKKIATQCEQTEAQAPEKYCESAYLAIARNYLQSGQTQIALKYFRDYAMKYPDSKCLNRVLYKIANIHETELHEYERALRLYYDFVETYPQSRLVDDAQQGIARCFEKLGNNGQAIKEYQKYLHLYPGANSYDEVEQKVDYLTKFHLKTETGALNRFASLIGDVINKPDQDMLTYKLALTYFNELKDYQTAASLLQQCESSSSASLPQDEILFYLAKSYHYLGEKNWYEKGAANADLDSAQNIYLRLIEKFSSSDWGDDAFIGLIEAKLLQTDDLEIRRKIIKESLPAFITNYPTSPYLDYAYYQLGNAYMTNNSSDSLTIVTNFQKVIVEYPQGKYAGTALFNYAKLLLSKGDKVNAKQKLMQYIDQFPRDKGIAEAHFILSRIAIEDKNNDEALSYLKKIANQYFYTSYIDSANSKIGDIYLNLKAYSEGIDYFLNLDADCEWDESKNSDDRQEVIFRLGQFYHQSGDKKKAITYYYDYLKQFPSSPHAPDVLFNLAELYDSHEAADLELALSLLKQLLNDFPTSPYNYTANLKVGDILFNQNEFLSAREHYLAAVKWADRDEKKLYPTMQAIICLYNSDQATRGDEETKQFDKQFKDVDDYLGQIELAKGDYYYNRKFFETAEKIYNSAKSKFKKTDYGPKAELALGRLYLTLNRDEEALKILTEMSNKYPDNNVIPDVYLALGEFYYLKARQVENAMLAYKTAIDHPAIKENSLAYGMSALIKCYFDLRLWDQALVLSRKYVERFPLAENTYDIRIQIGIIYYYLNEYDRAIDYLKKLKREADQESEPRIQYWIGDCYMDMGNFEQAITEYLKVKYISKPTKLDWAVTAVYRAGIAYMKLGNYDEAKKLFQKIILEKGAQSNFGKGAQQKIDEIEQLQKQDDRKS